MRLNNRKIQSNRIKSVDVVRGLAIIGVVIFHLIWDLEFTGLIKGIAYHPAWLAFGRVLAGSFMLLVGVSLVLGHGEVIRWRSFWKRIFVVAAAALLISIGTWFAFPDSFIFFGILHSIALASVVGVLFLRASVFVVLMMGFLILLAPWIYSTPIFNSRWLAWIGFFTIPPLSNDFVPFFPWAGLTFLGIAFAKIIELGKSGPSNGKSKDHFATNWVAWAGRNSLVIYLLHQPIMLGVIVPLSWL